MKTMWIVVGLLMFMVALFATFTIINPIPYEVQVDLGIVNSDLAAGPISWEFRVNGKEIPGNSLLKVWERRFNIEVIERSEMTRTIDELDIFSLIEDGDKIFYVFYPKSPQQAEEALYICIEHLDESLRMESLRMVSVNINK